MKCEFDLLHSITSIRPIFASALEEQQLRQKTCPINEGTDCYRPSTGCSIRHL